MAGSTESKIFAIFGGILDEGRYASFSLSTLYAFLAPLGISEEAARLVLSRMARKGYLTARRRGRASWYGLSPAGEAEVAGAVARTVRRPPPGSWDGRFRLVACELPEARRPERLALAEALEAEGFARTAGGLWAGAAEPGPRLRAVLAPLSAEGLAAEFDAAYRGDPRALSRRLFGLDERARAIEAFGTRYAAEAGALAAARAAGRPPSDAECFGRYFAALDDFVGLLVLVPPLPAELLPEDWPLPAAEAAYARFRDEVRAGTNAHIAACYRAPPD